MNKACSHDRDGRVRRLAQCIRVSNGEIELVSTHGRRAPDHPAGLCRRAEPVQELRRRSRSNGRRGVAQLRRRPPLACPGIFPRTYSPDNGSVQHAWEGPALVLAIPSATTGWTRRCASPCLRRRVPWRSCTGSSIEARGRSSWRPGRCRSWLPAGAQSDRRRSTVRTRTWSRPWAGTSRTDVHNDVPEMLQVETLGPMTRLEPGWPRSPPGNMDAGEASNCGCSRDLHARDPTRSFFRSRSRPARWTSELESSWCGRASRSTEASAGRLRSRTRDVCTISSRDGRGYRSVRSRGSARARQATNCSSPPNRIAATTR